jgi:hypothetical protein
VLLECSLGSFLEESINAFVQVLARHVVVNDAEPRDEYGSFVVDAIDLIGDLHELALLLDQLDLFSVGPTL